MELQERVKAARTHVGLTQGDLVELVKQLPGVESFSQQALTKLETGISQKSAFLIHIANICGINPYWLATGVGEMTPIEAGYTTYQIAETQKATNYVADGGGDITFHDEGQQEINKIWVTLPQEDRATLLSLAQRLANTERAPGTGKSVIHREPKHKKKPTSQKARRA